MGYTKEELGKKSVAELKEIAEPIVDEEQLEGLRAKAPIIQLILDAQSTDDEEEDDEVEELDDASDEEEEDDAPAASDDEEEDDIDDPELPEEDEVDKAPKPTAAKKSTAKQTKYTEGGKTESGEKLLGAKEVANAIGTEAKSLRQFFRSGKSSHFQAVGAGGRYEFKESDVAKIKEEYDAWKAGKPGRGRGASEGGSTRKRGSKGTAAPAEVIDEVEEIEELDDLEGPTSDADDVELEDDEEEE